MDVVWTALGGLLVVVVARELFHQIFRPEGFASLARLVMRGVFDAMPRRQAALELAGPLGVLLTILLWAGLLALGWALIYLPQLPHSFRLASGLASADTAGFTDALYLSLVTLTTLGYGDISPTATWLRVLAPIEALMGFAILSAGVTWVLSVFPVLGRRRALAQQVSLLMRDDAQPMRALLSSSPTHAQQILWGLTTQVTQVRSDLVQFPSSVFFHSPSAALSFSLALVNLRALAEIVADSPGASQHDAALLRSALASIASVLRERKLGGDETTTAGVLRSYAARHLHEQPPRSS